MTPKTIRNILPIIAVLLFSRESVAQSADTAAAAAWRKSEDGKIALNVKGKSDVISLKVLAQMMDLGIPVSSTQNSLIVANYPEESGMMGKYTHVLRVFVIPTSDSTSRVTLTAGETMTNGKYSKDYPVNYMSRGRAGHIWKTMIAIADSLQSGQVAPH
jgi:hypothetical protein